MKTITTAFYDTIYVDGITEISKGSADGLTPPSNNKFTMTDIYYNINGEDVNETDLFDLDYIQQICDYMADEDSNEYKLDERETELIRNTEKYLTLKTMNQFRRFAMSHLLSSDLDINDKNMLKEVAEKMVQIGLDQEIADEINNLY